MFLAGVVLGIGLAALALWGDFEAMSYFYSGAGYPSFSGLKCPVVLSRNEVATVSARLGNSSNEAVQPYYEVEISGIARTRTVENQVTVPAHSSKTVQWTVSAADVDIGYFVMMKMDILPMAGYSTREDTCGMVILNLGALTGGQFVGAGLGLSLLAILLGLVVREAGPEPVGGRKMSIRNGLRATGVLVCLALFTALGGSWLFGTLFCAMTVLLLVILLRMSVT
jgi:hypothetical protein